MASSQPPQPASGEGGCSGSPCGVRAHKGSQGPFLSWQRWASPAREHPGHRGSAAVGVWSCLLPLWVPEAVLLRRVRGEAWQTGWSRSRGPSFVAPSCLVMFEWGACPLDRLGWVWSTPCNSVSQDGRLQGFAK